MIGLGSNRLTVCRRGGMSVTQAGRGGMEWLGVRAPLWSSPYSAQATAALNAAFTAAQWPTIRDYGFAHPEIVGYMNAYAPEDAKIAYSLVTGLGIRWIKSDGSAAIDTGYNAQRATSVFTNEMLLFFNDVSRPHHHGFSGGRAGWWGVDSGKLIDTSINASDYIGKIYRHILEFNKNTAKYYIDDTYGSTQTGSASSTSGNIYLFAINDNGTISRWRNQDDCVLRNTIKDENGNIVQILVPYIKNGVLGMVDLITGDFKPNIGSGSFTISETPAS